MVNFAMELLIFSLIPFVCNAVRIHQRIGGGTPATAEEYPYQAVLSFNGSHECGGSIITEFHVLSAAHCVEMLFVFEELIPIVNVSILVGSMYLNSGTEYKVKRISYHKNFTTDSYIHYPNDISVIHTAEAIKFSSLVQPIALPPAYYEVPEGTPVTVAGFGSEQTGKPLSNTLNKLNLTTASLKKCYEANSGYILKDSHICTMDGSGIYGTCTGDAGNGLVDATKSLILGVVSAGSYLCTDFPDIYTKVSHYITYIQSEIKYDKANRISWNEHPAINYHI